MVVIIDECRDCPHHVAEQGTVVICDCCGAAMARNLFDAPRGPAYVTDCPVVGPAEPGRGGPQCGDGLP